MAYSADSYASRAEAYYTNGFNNNNNNNIIIIPQILPPGSHPTFAFNSTQYFPNPPPLSQAPTPPFRTNLHHNVFLAPRTNPYAPTPPFSTNLQQNSFPATNTNPQATTTNTDPPANEKKKAGRPKGSKNKPKDATPPEPKKRGRPAGSKDKGPRDGYHFWTDEEKKIKDTRVQRYWEGRRLRGETREAIHKINESLAGTAADKRPRKKQKMTAARTQEPQNPTSFAPAAIPGQLEHLYAPLDPGILTAPPASRSMEQIEAQLPLLLRREINIIDTRNAMMSGALDPTTPEERHDSQPNENDNNNHQEVGEDEYERDAEDEAGLDAWHDHGSDAPIATAGGEGQATPEERYELPPNDNTNDEGMKERQVHAEAEEVAGLDASYDNGKMAEVGGEGQATSEERYDLSATDTTNDEDMSFTQIDADADADGEAEFNGYPYDPFYLEDTEPRCDFELADFTKTY